MTTPAINIDTTTYLRGGYRVHYPGEIVEVSSGDFLSKYHRRTRPESSNSPLLGPGYRHPTEWVHDWTTISTPYTRFQKTHWWGVEEWYGGSNLAIGTPTIGPYNFKLEQRAINGALKKLKRQEINLSVCFKEREKTRKLFASTAKEMADGINRFRRKEKTLWQTVKHSVVGQGLPKKWLALVYGFEPLVKDMVGALTQIQTLEQGGYYPYRVTVRKKEFEGYNGTFDDWIYLFGEPSSPLLGTYADIEKCQCTLTYVMDTPSLQLLSALGITNPFSAAWELLPFSFLVDWAVPVGTWLDLQDADFGWHFVSGSVSRMKEVAGRGSRFIPYPGVSLVEGNPGEFSFSLGSFSRYGLVSTPWPQLEYPRNPLSSSRHKANASALVLAGAFKR